MRLMKSLSEPTMAKLTKKRATEIAQMVKDKFNPEKKTSNGKYTAYVREKVDDIGGIVIKWKDGKEPVFEPSRYQAIDITELSKKDLELMVEQYDNLVMIAEAINEL